MSKPTHWILRINGVDDSKPYYQRAAARGAAIVLRAQGYSVDVIPRGF